MEKEEREDQNVCRRLGPVLQSATEGWSRSRDVLLERLGQIEALLHVVVVGGGGVDVPDAAVASVHPTVLLQSLKESHQGCFRRLWSRSG